MTNHEIKLGINLLREIEKRQISQKDLSIELGMRQSTLHSYLYGAIPNVLQNAIKLADHFGLSLDDLVLK